MRARYLTVIIILLSATVTTQAQSSVQVDEEVVGGVPGYHWTFPSAINNRGEIVGSVSSPGTPAGYHAFLWTREAGFTIIMEDAVATDINERGDVVGSRLECTLQPWGWSCPFRGFVWNKTTGVRDLGDFAPTAVNNNGDMAGTCPGAGVVVACAIHNGIRTEWPCELIECASLGEGINERGDVVGGTQDPLGPVGGYAMLYRPDGGSVVLGPGGALAINNAGVIAAVMGNLPTGQAAVTRWRRGRVSQVGALGYAVPVAINARGWTVGIEFRNGGMNVAFLWTTAGTSLLYLGTDHPSSEAVDINDKGEIVGFVDVGSGVREVVIWRAKR